MRQGGTIAGMEECPDTQRAFLWTYVLNTPFWALYNLLPFILFRDLGATPLQITAMITLKPVVSIFSVYWSDYVHQRSDRLISNVIGGCVLSHLPFFFFPFVENVWFFVASFAIYMLLHRGVIPAWMEILKLNLPNVSRQKLFARASSLSYMGSALLPLFFGWMLDEYVQSWRWIFPIAALISLSAVLLQLRIPIQEELREQGEPPKEWIKRPWQRAWSLLKQRPDYGLFQWGFMLGGFGIMVLQPCLPKYFMENLGLNYLELSFAITFCKGVGFALTSGLWARAMTPANIFKISSYVMLFLIVYVFCLFFAQHHLYWIFFAYLFYGIMQAGSELTWRMSGPIFAKDEDSSLYSSINVLTVGIRGCIANPLGGLLYNPSLVMGIGLVLFIWGAIHQSICHARLYQLWKNKFVN